MSRYASVLAGLALLSACGDAAGPDASAVAAGPSPDASNPAATSDSIPASAFQSDSAAVDYEAPVTLVSMDNGDAACYLNVRTDAGGERTDYADFRICERDDLVGQRVVLTATPSAVMAPSCEGNPDCPDTETVNLVTGIDLADAGTAPATGDAAADGTTASE